MVRTKAKATRKTAGRKTAAKKTTAKKTTRKTAATKKATGRKTAVTAKKTTKKAAPTSAIKDGFNKSQIYTYISETTDLSKKEVSNVFETFGNLMHRHLRKNGVGEFTVPGLMKCVVKRKPATKARKGVNPFTGEEMMFKAKPARNIVKVRPLKKLKEMVE